MIRHHRGHGGVLEVSPPSGRKRELSSEFRPRNFLPEKRRRERKLPGESLPVLHASWHMLPRELSGTLSQIDVPRTRAHPVGSPQQRQSLSVITTDHTVRRSQDTRDVSLSVHRFSTRASQTYKHFLWWVRAVTEMSRKTGRSKCFIVTGYSGGCTSL